MKGSVLRGGVCVGGGGASMGLDFAGRFVAYPAVTPLPGPLQAEEHGLRACLTLAITVCSWRRPTCTWCLYASMFMEVQVRVTMPGLCTNQRRWVGIKSKVGKEWQAELQKKTPPMRPRPANLLPLPDTRTLHHQLGCPSAHTLPSGAHTTPPRYN